MRAIVYPHKVQALRDSRTASLPGAGVFGGRADHVTSSTGGDVAAATPDDYLARLAKHVPAESLAVLLLLAGQLQHEALGWRVSAVTFPALMAVTIDRERRARMEAILRPRGLIYDAFVVVAYAGWALGTTDLARGLVGIDQAESSFIVLIIAFGLGWFDDRLGALFEAKDDRVLSAGAHAPTSRPAGPGSRQPPRKSSGDS